MPEARQRLLKDPVLEGPLHLGRVHYTYTCPQGQTLRFNGTQQAANESRRLVYRATCAVCRRCPAFGICTKSGRDGRSIFIGPTTMCYAVIGLGCPPAPQKRRTG